MRPGAILPFRHSYGFRFRGKVAIVNYSRSGLVEVCSDETEPKRESPCAEGKRRRGRKNKGVESLWGCRKLVFNNSPP